MRALGRDFAVAVRTIWRAPRFAAAVVVTLGLAIGGGGALFSLLDAVAVRPLAVDRPERLVVFHVAAGEAIEPLPVATLDAYAGEQRSLEGVCGVLRGARPWVEVNGLRTRRPAETVTGSCSRTLGIQPFLGRLLDERDAPMDGQAAPVAVVSHAFWQRELGGEASAVGRTLLVEDTPVTIVGVMPASFSGLNADVRAELVLPLELHRRLMGVPSVFAHYAVGRLRDGVTEHDAHAELQSLWPELWRRTNPPPPGNRVPRAATADALHMASMARGFSELRRHTPALVALVALAGLLLALAITNVAALFLARFAAREPELRIHLALGAGHRRLARQSAAEGLLLALCAALLAVPVAWWASKAVAQTMWTSVQALTMTVTPARLTLLVVAGVAFGAGLIVSVLPLLLLRATSGHALAGTTRHVTARTAGWRRALLVTQVALAFVLLFTATLFARNVAGIRGLDPGYEPDSLRWARLDVPPGGLSGIDRAEYFRNLLDRISSALPASRVALSTSFPNTEVRHLNVPTTAARVDAPETEIRVRVEGVSPRYFEATGIGVIRGREFDAGDAVGSEAVAIVNTALATRLFGDADPTGQPIVVRGQPWVIVGVARTASPGDRRIQDFPSVFRPLLQDPFTQTPTIIIGGGGANLEPALRAVIEPLGHHIVAAVHTVDESLERFLARERVLAGLSAALGGLAAMVTALGLYALLAYSVARRAREFGIRLAVGATPRRVITMVIADGLRLTFAGIAIGIPLAYAAAQMAASLLFDLALLDTRSLAAAVAFLVVTTAAACATPALRASAIDPASTLRSD